MASIERPKIVITGYGCITDIGHDANSTWEAMLAGERGLDYDRKWLEAGIPEAYHRRLRTHVLGRITDEIMAKNPGIAAIDERFRDRYLSRSAVLAWGAASEAIRHSGIVESEAPTRKAFVVGTGIGGGMELADLELMMINGIGLPSTSMNKSQPDNATVMMAMDYGLRGPSGTLNAACASGNAAQIEAYRKLVLGEADYIVAGGTEGLHPAMVASFEKTKAGYIADKDPSEGQDPDLGSRPYHQQPGGVVLSEAGAFMTMETEEHALARGATIYSEFAGYSETNDASDPTLLTGEGLFRAMALALQMARINADQKGAIQSHATGAIKGDPQEGQAIRDVFSNQPLFTGEEYEEKQIYGRVTSVKGYTGHSVGAVNAVQGVIAQKQLEEQVMPPAVWLANGDKPPACIEGMENLVPHTQSAEASEFDFVLSNGMGFGGQNASVVYRRYR